jgi:hypothetical protein
MEQRDKLVTLVADVIKSNLNEANLIDICQLMHKTRIELDFTNRTRRQQGKKAIAVDDWFLEMIETELKRYSKEFGNSMHTSEKNNFGIGLSIFLEQYVMLRLEMPR